MDNETPRYATWIPEAGGYVANGNVVSKSPMYDEAGKLKLDVDTSVFGNTQPLKTQPQVANQAQSNVGVTTANIQGSGTDANAAVTNIGNMASLADNKQNGLDSVLSSPAMRSPSAGEPILTVEQQDLKEIQDAKARNDLQGMINGYVKLGRDTGVDYSATISDLTKQRQQKIQTIDDQYLQSIDEARRAVNTARDVANISGKKEDQQAYYAALEEYNNLLNEQGTWRNSVGYADAMAQKRAAEEEAIQLDFEFAYNTAINDVANQLIQMYPTILNFQYNPNTDTSLYIAQGYAQSRVKETMNATGMYYSTMTQSAIAKAVAELVPVYEKMARQEAIENFQLLQSTASFLMNLEQTQFNLWKSQIEMKWQENAEKRKAIAQAIENANARGYFTNEEAALLGVAPGTESPDAQARAQAKQDQIEAEQRKLIQDKALERFKTDMDIELLKEQNKLKPASEDTGLTYDIVLKTVEGMVKGGATEDDIIDFLNESGLTYQQKNSILQRVIYGLVNDDEEERAKLDNLTLDERNAISNIKVAQEYNKYKKDGNVNYSGVAEFIDSIATNYSQEDASEIASIYAAQVVKKIKDNATKYNDDFSNNSKLLNLSTSEIAEFANNIINKTESYNGKDADKILLWETLVDSIYGTPVRDASGKITSIEGAKTNLNQFDLELSDIGSFEGTLNKTRERILNAIKKQEGGTDNKIYTDIRDAIDLRMSMSKELNKKPTTSTSGTSLTEAKNKAQGMTSTPTPSITAPTKK